ncbi:M16 family metallopeptidase [Nannocystis sp. SCPEA4]|uniref:M16 family metallopeptidase n=1 Tax=Nannocystis sp. SCPEA4 TaxID=2996787 RepID=UPI00226FE180|nr:M16 family metallopeptidase [Nannocystis sp. SCPEA4]MCY1062797.1 insulinase family protein [Nannocystis sp. SCPEA4]
MPRARPLLAMLAVLLLVGCRALPRPARSFDDRPEGVVVDYDNGLRLVVAPDLSGDLVQVHMRVRAGARNEAKHQAGLAHLSEHIVLCALPLPDGRTVCDALAEEALNYRASTDGDAVTIAATTVAAHLPTVLGLFAFVLSGRCDVSPGQFTRERNVVISELQQRFGASLDAYQQFLESVYPPDHPYAHVSGGTWATVSRLTAGDACGYLRDRFTPGNAAVVVTGGVSHDQVVRAAEATLRPLAPRPTSPQVAAPPVVGARPPRRTLAGLGTAWGTALVFPLPPQDSDDGRLSQLLVDMIERALADAAREHSGLYDFSLEQLGGADAPMLALFATVSTAEQRADSEDVLWETLAVVQKDVVDRKQAQTLLRRLRIDVARRLERLDARAERYLELTPNTRRGVLATDLRRLDALTPAALARTAKALFARDRAQVVALEPADAAQGLVLRDVVRPPEGAHAVAASPAIAAKLLAEIPAANRSTRYTLANGLTVILAPSSSPLVDVRLIVAAGFADAPAEQPYLAPVVATLLLAPAAKSPADKDLRRLRATGANVELSIAPDLTIFQTRGLATDTDHLLRGIGGVVVDGHQHADYRDWAAEEVIQGIIASLRAEPQRKQMARFSLDRCDELDAISPGPLPMPDLTEFRRKHYRAGAATLIVAGGFDDAVARAHIDDVFGRAVEPWSLPVASEEPAPTRPAPAVRPGAYRIAGQQQEQVSVFLGFVVPPELRRDRATVLLLRQLLENATGAVREKLGVSYGVIVTREELCEAEVIVLHGNIDAGHFAAAVAELRGAFARLRTPAGVAAELPAAQRPVAGRLLAEAADSAVIADRLTFLVQQKLPLDYFRSEARRVVDIDPARLAELFTASLAPERLFVVCRGPDESTGPCDELPRP